MLVFPIISLLMFWIAILLYFLDKRQLMSSKIAVAATYIVIAYFMGLGSVPSIHIINSFVIVSMIVFFIGTVFCTYMAMKKDVFRQYQEKSNYQKICLLVSFYIWLVLLLVAYFPGIFNPSASHEIKVLLGGILLYLVWNAWSYLLHLLVYPQHIIREFPSYIVISDLYDTVKSVTIAKGIYELYHETAIILLGVSQKSHYLEAYAREEFSANTAIVEVNYDGTAKDLLKETKEALYDLDVIDEGIVIASEEDYLRLGLLAKKVNLEADIAIILADSTTAYSEKMDKQLRVMMNCFRYEAYYHYIAIAVIIILAIAF
ncbi:hypothetical protein SAMN05421767_10136 [Granulicatella balaenopterae]|uniref:Uncharacterized protein n=1 Tax=Granulicatella balaenopterae TaxID=137733 RepID=A0A1H9GSV4_9LACT|nr:hypothetical protein [Granulicatella balaenopterae]SEQ53150.1 hypothetical protein SAMN05421767_10136 [Granulicatella balaenopterae]